MYRIRTGKYTNLVNFYQEGYGLPAKENINRQYLIDRELKILLEIEFSLEGNEPANLAEHCLSIYS